MYTRFQLTGNSSDVSSYEIVWYIYVYPINHNVLLDQPYFEQLKPKVLLFFCQIDNYFHRHVIVFAFNFPNFLSGRSLVGCDPCDLTSASSCDSLPPPPPPLPPRKGRMTHAFENIQDLHDSGRHILYSEPSIMLTRSRVSMVKFDKVVRQIILDFKKPQHNTNWRHAIWFWLWRYDTRGLIWHLSQSSIRPSIYF